MHKLTLCPSTASPECLDTSRNTNKYEHNANNSRNR